MRIFDRANELLKVRVVVFIVAEILTEVHTYWYHCMITCYTTDCANHYSAHRSSLQVQKSA